MTDNKKMMKTYTVMWGIIAVVYGLWMSIFMSWDQYPYIIPTEADMLLPADQFIAKFDGMLQQPLYESEIVYYLWVVLSAVILFLYPLFFFLLI